MAKCQIFIKTVNKFGDRMMKQLLDDTGRGSEQNILIVVSRSIICRSLVNDPQLTLATATFVIGVRFIVLYLFLWKRDIF